MTTSVDRRRPYNIFWYGSLNIGAGNDNIPHSKTARQKNRPYRVIHVQRLDQQICRDKSAAEKHGKREIHCYRRFSNNLRTG